VLEAVLIMQNGYPFRLDHSHFREKYHMLIRGTEPMRHKAMLFDRSLFAVYQKIGDKLPSDYDALVRAARAARRKGELPLDMSQDQCVLMKQLLLDSLVTNSEVLQAIEVG
jgi:hypothetical protein